MMKILNGAELADYIKERQAKQVRNLRQAWGVLPKLSIIATIDSPVIDTYMRLKQAYGEDILVDVDIHKVDQADIMATIERLNSDEDVQGIIVQLPLHDSAQTDTVVNAVNPSKDVDGLGEHAAFTAATPQAIDWLLVGFGVELRGKKIAVVGNGRLVGRPLVSLWTGQGHDVTVFDDTAQNLSTQLRQFDVIVSATGVPRLITSDAVKIGAIVVDAGTASEHGKIVGDVDDSVRLRDDITITPVKGGVGPLTVAALFDNVITAARRIADAKSGDA